MSQWFADVLIRFGYDLFEHEHLWDGEWIDDDFEAAALELRSTGAKLMRVLNSLEPFTAEAELTPLRIDLGLTYLDRLLSTLSIAVPCCFGQEGRVLVGARGDLAAMAVAVTDLDPKVGQALTIPKSFDIAFPTHAIELYPSADAAGRPALPKALASVREESMVITTDAIRKLDAALSVLCPWLDRVLAELQRTIAARADDGDELLERWASPDWSVIRLTTPTLTHRLPVVPLPGDERYT